MDLSHNVTPAIPRTPRAPQGPSDEELNRVPPDPVIPPFAGSAALFGDMICGYGDTVYGIIRRE